MLPELFSQPAPELGNQYRDDRVLRSYLTRILPPDVLRAVEPSLEEMGELAGGELYRMQLADRANEPVLTQWDAWGERADRIELTPLWRRAERVAAEHGVVAAAYETAHGRYSRPYQFALAYLFHPSTDVYTCPLAMTDGAARTLVESRNAELIERAVGRLTTRDPARFWTSGQWMTESTRGSDVGLAQTVARREAEGWRLYGRKWFTSAVSSQMALVLARPEGNPPGAQGLALFYVEPRDEAGRLSGIRVLRLKDKLGTRKVPTAELMLEGAPAQAVRGTSGGVKAIVPMLHLTRAWNSIAAAAVMRRGLALARDYARKRYAFGDLLARKPLHVDTLAQLHAESEGAFLLSFHLAELIGRSEAEELAERDADFMRLLTSLAKLVTAKQAVAVASESLEAFGGAGYVEDTGLPMLLRDTQVLSIWEGTTNVLSLDAVRALRGGGGWSVLVEKVGACIRSARDPRLGEAGRAAESALAHARSWFEQASRAGPPVVEAGARRFALTLGRALELALLVEHAQWCLDHERDGRGRAAAVRFAQSGVDAIADVNARDSHALGTDESLAAE
jgi:acyl-CoA dehydrogenase